MLLFPSFPFFVVMRITPLAPREPYMVVAEASFRMSNDSISLGLIKFSGFVAGAPPIPAAETPSGEVVDMSSGTPSITYKGCWLERMVLAPRMRICAPAPGSPLFWVICTPAILPCINCSGVAAVVRLKSSSLTEPTAPVRSLFFDTP